MFHSYGTWKRTKQDSRISTFTGLSVEFVVYEWYIGSNSKFKWMRFFKLPTFSSPGNMSFKFNKKAVVTGVSSVEAGKLLVYAQTVKKISSENGCSLDGNIFCVDVGAAALKKQSKKERRWLEEEADNAKITPGTIITVNGKERYVKTEVCK